MTKLTMECNDRADDDTSQGRDECLRVKTAPDECPPCGKRKSSSRQRRPARGRNSSPQPEHNQLREDGVTREDRVSNISNDLERASRSYEKFQKKANHSPGRQQAPPDPARTRTASRSASSPAEQREESVKRHTKEADTTHDGLSQRRSYGSKLRG